jgi:hypothetical protein
MRSSIVSFPTGERNSVSQFEDINAKLFQLSFLLGRLQIDVQANAVSSVFPVPVPSGSVLISGQHIEDYVLQMRKELDVFSSRIKNESVTIDGVTFESYDGTLRWVDTHCHKDDWNYVMDVPALYSLVKTDGQGHKNLKNMQTQPMEDTPKPNKLITHCLFNARFLKYLDLESQIKPIIHLGR